MDSVVMPVVFKLLNLETMSRMVAEEVAGFINNSDSVFFLVSGTGKDKVLQSILEDPDGAGRCFPACMVKPKKRLVWFIYEAAAYF